jgi:hypothetical protein
VGKIRDLLSNGSSIEMIIDSELRSKLSNCYSVQATKFYWFAGRSSAFLFMFQTIANVGFKWMKKVNLVNLIKF